MSKTGEQLLKMDPVNVTYKTFNPQEMFILMDMMSIFDNRHDFRPGTRNMSIDLNNLLQLLREKADQVRSRIDTSVREENRSLFHSLLNRHCLRLKPGERYNKASCGTSDNPDKDVEEFIFKRIFKEPIIETQRHTKKNIAVYNPTQSSIDVTKILRFQDKDEIIKACACTIDEETGRVLPIEKKRNPLLDKLIAGIALKAGGVNPEDIRFCIDVSKVGDWFFRHDGLSNPPETHLQTIADDYDTFSANPNRTPLPTSFQLTDNHIALSAFNFYHSDETDRVAWSSQLGTDNPINLATDIRVGVKTFADAIRIVLEHKKYTQSKAAIFIKNLFQLPPSQPSIRLQERYATVYGKHIMDFKRLMDISKLAVARLYNNISVNNKNYYVVLVTHDTMLFLVAKLLGCPVILTLHSTTTNIRDLIFDIPQNITDRQKIAYKFRTQPKAKQRVRRAPEPPAPTPKRQKTVPQILLRDIVKDKTFIGGPIKPSQIPIQTKMDPVTLFEIVLNNYMVGIYNTKVDKLEEVIEKEKAIYIRIIEELNDYLQNPPTPLEEKINRIIGNLRKVELQSDSIFYEKTLLFIKLLTELKQDTPSMYNIKKDITKAVLSNIRFQEAKFKSVTFKDDVYQKEIEKLKQNGGSSVKSIRKKIDNYALDFIYNFINKNINKYEALIYADQMKYLAIEPELENLINEYKKRDTEHKVVSAPTALVPFEQANNITRKIKTPKSPGQLLAEMAEP